MRCKKIRDITATLLLLLVFSEMAFSAPTDSILIRCSSSWNNPCFTIPVKCNPNSLPLQESLHTTEGLIESIRYHSCQKVKYDHYLNIYLSYEQHVGLGWLLSATNQNDQQLYCKAYNFKQNDTLDPINYPYHFDSITLLSILSHLKPLNNSSWERNELSPHIYRQLDSATLIKYDQQSFFIEFANKSNNAESIEPLCSTYGLPTALITPHRAVQPPQHLNSGIHKSDHHSPVQPFQQSTYDRPSPHPAMPTYPKTDVPDESGSLGLKNLRITTDYKPSSHLSTNELTHPPKFSTHYELHNSYACRYDIQQKKSKQHTRKKADKEITYDRKDLVRVCLCGNKDTRESLLNTGRANDSDGYEVHWSKECCWEQYQDLEQNSKNTHKFLLIRRCYCYKPW